MKFIDDEQEYLKAKAKLEKEMKQAGEGSQQVEITQEEYKTTINEFYATMDYILDYYMDIPKETKNLVILWTLGTYFHKNFNTYPYLFLNAMRGSGKTRLLKIIESFANKGQLVLSITEAVLFRTLGTLLLDEFEGINRKGSENLKELLNSAYKQGTKVFRMKKKKVMGTDEQVVETFQPYRPVVMANIYGMEEVLGDRCINLQIEKSNDESRIRLVEDFQNFEILKEIREKMQKIAFSVVSCSVVTSGNVDSKWNIYVKSKVTTPTTLYTSNTYNYTKLHQNELRVKEDELLLKGQDVLHQDFQRLFDKIYSSNIDGRHLELFFPLFILASELNDELLDYTINTASIIVQQKKVDEVTESKDVLVYEFVSKQEEKKWNKVNNLASLMRLTLGDGEMEWFNSKWLGRALKRLNLVLEKKRSSEGMEVILNVQKAKQKYEIFKPKQEAKL